MKIALDHTGEVGFRTGRVLLGDKRVRRIGLVGRAPSRRHQGRVEKAGELADYDLLVTDATSPGAHIRDAIAAGVHCVVWVEPDGEEADTGGVTVLTGANLASGIAPCLASHEVAMAHESPSVVVAWTEPGTPLRSGEPLAFPDPVGGRWGRRHGKGSDDAFVAPVSGDWAGALARVTPDSNGSAIRRIVGVADLAPHLEALALAAGALAVGSGAHPVGWTTAVDADREYLAEALGAGLDVAAYTLTD